MQVGVGDEHVVLIEFDYDIDCSKLPLRVMLSMMSASGNG
jgi:hypothetical protein